MRRIGQNLKVKMQNYNSKFKTDLIGRCFNLSLRVIKICDQLPKKRSAWVIADQLIRATCSIGANLTEAKAASSRLEFKRFYEIALKSANEAGYWLMLLSKSSLADEKIVGDLTRELTEISNMIASGVLRLKGKKF